jgi:hypothetical protein
MMKQSDRAHIPSQQASFWTNARASVAHCRGQFAGQNNVELAAKVERLCLLDGLHIGPTTEPGPMPSRSVVEASVSEPDRTTCG